jgi:hypothetical protein
MSPETTSKTKGCEKDYSVYMGWMYNQAGTYTFICGFTFSILTLLIINLPNPDSIISQGIMIFFTILFDLLLYVILLIGVEALQFCDNVPPFTKNLRMCYILSDTVIVLWGFSVPLIFLLWGIVYLAVLSAIIWTLFMIVSNFTVRRPFKRYRGITKGKRDIE